MSNETKQLRCAFCGKDASEVKQIVSSGVSRICNECIRLVTNILVPDTNETKKAPRNVPVHVIAGVRFVTLETFDAVVAERDVALAEAYRLSDELRMANSGSRLQSETYRLVAAELERVKAERDEYLKIAARVTIANCTGCGVEFAQHSVLSHMRCPECRYGPKRDELRALAKRLKVALEDTIVQARESTHMMQNMGGLNAQLRVAEQVLDAYQKAKVIP